MKCHTAWGIELAELDGVTRRSDQESLKTFLTERIDTFRAPYARPCAIQPAPLASSPSPFRTADLSSIGLRPTVTPSGPVPSKSSSPTSNGIVVMTRSVP